jgi:hypothetical protein
VSFSPLPPSAEDNTPREPIVMRELSLQERAVRPSAPRSVFVVYVVAARIGDGGECGLRLFLQAFSRGVRASLYTAI